MPLPTRFPAATPASALTFEALLASARGLRRELQPLAFTLPGGQGGWCLRPCGSAFSEWSNAPVLTASLAPAVGVEARAALRPYAVLRDLARDSGVGAIQLLVPPDAPVPTLPFEVADYLVYRQPLPAASTERPQYRPSPVRIRSAGEADLPRLVAYAIAMADETEEGRVLNPDTVERGLRSLLSNPSKGRLLVACDAGGEPVGKVIVAGTQWPSRGEPTWGLWLTTAFTRGDWQRQGVFAALFERHRAAALATGGVGSIRLMVKENNTGAQRSYRNAGFLPTGERVWEHRLEGGHPDTAAQTTVQRRLAP